MSTHTGLVVEVRWCRSSGGTAPAEACARDIFGMLSGLRQRPADAPVAFTPPAPIDRQQTAQVLEPISYFRAAEQLAGVQWSEIDVGTFVFVTESGEILEPKTRVPVERSLKLGHVSRRRSKTVYVRPGQGGYQRRWANETDPFEGLDAAVSKFGEILWWSAPGSATIGVLEMHADGNSVLCHRLSSEDRNETLVAQFKPNLALARRKPGILIPRYALFAVNMSGTREVRPDRAGPPPPGCFERDDMLQLDKWIAEGWVEHIVWRDSDRIARDVLPGETLFKRWRENRVGLWLASYGRMLDYRTDKLQLRAMNMVNSEDRDRTVDKLQLAKLNKGPLTGNGWGPCRFGFMRINGVPTVDTVQWPWTLRAFELADEGHFFDKRGLSTRQLAAALLAEGCPFDHDTLRRMLADPIYATGEWTQNVREIPIEQRPIKLDRPVPLDRFERVQNLLALRQGNTKRTPLGEFLFNYVECVHKQCVGSLNRKGKQILIKGFIDERNAEGTRRYSHQLLCPPQCKSGGRGHGGHFTWNRHELEPPVIEEIRKLALHPELLRQAALAARHQVAETSSRLTDAQRAELELEINRLEKEFDAAVDAQVEKIARGTSLDVDAYEKLCQRIRRKIDAAKRRLEADEAAALRGGGAGDSAPDRVKSFLEVMTVETPEDPALRQLRARIFQRIISRIEIDDGGEGPITITVYGHLVPEDIAPEHGNPILAATDLLDAYESIKAGKTPAQDSAAVRWSKSQTDFSEVTDKSVWECYPELLEMPGELARAELKRSRIADRAWGQRRLHAVKTGSPAWCTSVTVALGSNGDPTSRASGHN
jgi:hypothetical protein